MPVWKPEPIWKDQDVFIIGGGTSLRDFNWPLLKNENTIGCNNAFRLGPEICKICLFVDRKFLYSGPNHPREGFYNELKTYANTNWVVTNDNQFLHDCEPWIKVMPRLVKGFSATPDKLCFNDNSGAAAVNLACLLGASNVYLLGYDMHLNKNGEPNWHTHIIDKPSHEVYVRFLASFGRVSRGVREHFPNCKVFNVTKNSSLDLFPKLDPDIFWKERKDKNEKLSKENFNSNITTDVCCGVYN